MIAVVATAAVGGLLTAASVALQGLLLSPDAVSGWLCTAAENLPCRPLTLECLFAGAGGLAAGLPALPPPYREDRDPRAPREYAPEPPPGYQPPQRQSPQDALGDDAFRQAREDWARDNADRVYPTAPPDRARGGDIADLVVQSIRNSSSRR